MTIPGKSAYLVLQILNTVKTERKKIWGAEASDEHDAELARHAASIACSCPNPFLKTQEIKKEPAH